MGARITRCSREATQTAELSLSLLVLVAFALAFGYLMVRAVGFYQPTEYLPNWGNAHWIGGEETATTRYFRYRFDVQGAPAAAYLIVGGSEELSVYVNGKLVTQGRYLGARVTEIRDLRSYLTDGYNLIAIRVSAQRWEAQPRLIARLVLETVEGTRRELLSGPDWNVSAREMREAAEEIDWTATSFDDSTWPNAVVKHPREDLASLPLDIPEALFAAPKATWNIWSTDPRQQATLVRDLEIPGNAIRGAWLEVGFTGQYTILLNGRRLHSQVGDSRTAELFAVGRYLRPGANRLELSAETAQLYPHLYARLLVDAAQGKLWIPSDGRWGTPSATPEIANSYRPVQLLDRAGSSPEERKVRVVMRDLSFDETFLAPESWSAAVSAACVLLVVALTFPLFHISVRSRTTGVDESFGLFVQPFLLGLLLLVGLILFDADVRFHAASGPGVTAIAVIAGVVITWLAFISLEARLHGSSHRD